MSAQPEKMTKELHLKLVAAWWDGELETTLGAGLWEKAPFHPNDEADPSFFRIRPKPTLRPWKPEEVPLGAQVKSFDGNDRSIIVAVNCQQFWIGAGDAPIPFGFARDFFIHSLDGGRTWKPCGVPSGEFQ